MQVNIKLLIRALFAWTRQAGHGSMPLTHKFNLVFFKKNILDTLIPKLLQKSKGSSKKTAI